METTYNESFAELERRIRKSEMFAILNIINKKSDEYRHILQNGQEIFYQSTGDRFVRMLEFRNKLWAKIFAHEDIVSTIFDNRI